MEENDEEKKKKKMKMKSLFTCLARNESSGVSSGSMSMLIAILFLFT